MEKMPVFGLLYVEHRRRMARAGIRAIHIFKKPVFVVVSALILFEMAILIQNYGFQNVWDRIWYNMKEIAIVVMIVHSIIAGVGVLGYENEQGRASEWLLSGLSRTRIAFEAICAGFASYLPFMLAYTAIGIYSVRSRLVIWNKGMMKSCGLYGWESELFVPWWNELDLSVKLGCAFAFLLVILVAFAGGMLAGVIAKGTLGRLYAATVYGIMHFGIPLLYLYMFRWFWMRALISRHDMKYQIPIKLTLMIHPLGLFEYVGYQMCDWSWTSHFLPFWNTQIRTLAYGCALFQVFLTLLFISLAIVIFARKILPGRRRMRAMKKKTA